MLVSFELISTYGFPDTFQPSMLPSWRGIQYRTLFFTIILLKSLKSQEIHFSNKLASIWKQTKHPVSVWNIGAKTS